MNNTVVRVIVGIIGIPIILVFAVLGNYFFLTLCVLLSFFCMNEFYNLFEKPKKEPGKLTKWAGGFSFHKFVFLLISSLIVVCLYYQWFNFVLILYFIMFVYLIIDEVVKTDKHFEAIGSWMLSIVYISTPFGLLSLMDSNKFINEFGVKYSILCLVLVWVSDSCAFFGGKTFCRHKLAERISPKKTWEGSIIGFTCSVIAGLILRYTLYKDFSLIHNFILSSVLTMIITSV